MLARIGSLCIRHRRTVLAVTALLFVTGVVVGSGVFMQLKESRGNARAESVQGALLLDAGTDDDHGLVAVVDGPSVDDAAVRQAVERAAARVERIDGVVNVTTAYSDADPMLRSADGQASLIAVTTKRTDDMMTLHQLVGDVRSALSGSVPGANVTVGGELAVMRDSAVTSESDLVRGEIIALPVLLLALLLVFRGFRAAVIPLVASLVTVAGGLLLLLGAAHLLDVSGYAVDVIALFGLALSVDYSLLMVSRFREERGAGHPADQAVIRTLESAGRTITFSALTVTASLCGLFAFRDPTFNSLAVGGIATTMVALITGLFVVPALLAGLGRTIHADVRKESDAGAFGSLARRVQKRPLLVALGATLGLMAVALPFLSVNYGSGDPRLLPRTFESRTVADLLHQRFPQMQAEPITVVVERSADDPTVQAYAARLRTAPGVAAATVAPSGRQQLAVIDVTPVGTTQGPAAQQVVEWLRAHRPGFPTHVTGSVAFLVDFRHQVSTHLPWALLLIGLSTFVLLFLMTGSVVVPLKALVMNMLSLGATYGALVWVFQQGHLSGLLGFEPFGAIEAWVPVVVFVFAFGLSMDYEVFLLSRIKERYDATADNDAAVAGGLQRSGRIITSAAALVLIVFLGFALGDNLGIKEMGLALAVAVAVDATIVRCLLVPATMTLLGDRNWWAPPRLRRLHDRFGLREAPSPRQPSVGLGGDQVFEPRDPALHGASRG